MTGKYSAGKRKHVGAPRRSLRRATVISCTILFLAGGTALTLRVQSSRLHEATYPTAEKRLRISTATASSVHLSYPITLPDGFAAPSGLVAVPSGVWFFDASQNTRELFYWSSSSSSLVGYELPPSDNDDPALAVSSRTPMAIDAAGNIWIGINRAVLRFDPQTLSWSRTDLPADPLVASDVLSPPPFVGSSPYSFEVVDALIAPSDGSIVVGRMFSSVLDVISSTGDVSALPLPTGSVLPGDGPKDLAALPGGEVGAVLYRAGVTVGSWQLGLANSNGQWSDSTPCSEVTGVTSASGVVVAFGPNCIAWATASASGGIGTFSVMQAAQNFGSVTNAIATGESWVLADHSGGQLDALSSSSGQVATTSDQVSVETECMSTSGTEVWFTEEGAHPYIGAISVP